MNVRRLVVALCQVAISAALLPMADAQQPADVLQRVGFDQRLGQSLPPDLELRDHTGRRVKLGDFLAKRPVILALVYYECPMLCTLELNGLVRSLRALELAAGRDFEILTVSFDPRDTPSRAAAKRQAYLEQLDCPDANAGWQFLTGDQPAIDRLCQAVGFRAVYDERTKQYAHASGIVVVTPDGRISRYFLGIDYPARDLRLALVEASGGRVGSPADRLLLLCYGYDPMTGKYGLLVMNLVRAGGLATVLLMAGAIGIAFLRERVRSAAAPAPLQKTQERAAPSRP